LYDIETACRLNFARTEKRVKKRNDFCLFFVATEYANIARQRLTVASSRKARIDLTVKKHAKNSTSLPFQYQRRGTGNERERLGAGIANQWGVEKEREH